MSQDQATALQPGQQSKTQPQNKQTKTKTNNTTHVGQLITGEAVPVSGEGTDVWEISVPSA